MEALLLTVYFLVVIYVLYQMALSLEDRLEDKVIIHLDQDFLAEQTQAQLSTQADASHIDAIAEQQGFDNSKATRPVITLAFDPHRELPLDSPQLEALRDMGLDDEQIRSSLKKKIAIQVSPTGRQPLRAVSYLSILVVNDTADAQIYINWDRSSLEMFGQGNRVIRATPNMPLDLTQAQVFSTVNPGQSMVSDVTIEKNYVRDAASNQVKLARPLVDLKERVERSQLTDPNSSQKNIQPLYGLDLMIGLKRTTEPDSRLINLLVPFSFTLEIEADQIALPPLRWLLHHFGRRNRPLESLLWGRQQRQRR